MQYLGESIWEGVKESKKERKKEKEGGMQHSFGESCTAQHLPRCAKHTPVVHKAANRQQCSSQQQQQQYEDADGTAINDSLYKAAAECKDCENALAYHEYLRCVRQAL